MRTTFHYDKPHISLDNLMHQARELRIKRLNSGKPYALIVDKKYTRIAIRCVPTDIDKDFEVGILNFNDATKRLPDEEILYKFSEHPTPLSTHLFSIEHGNHIIDSGFMIVIDQHFPISVLSGEMPGNIAVQCPGSQEADFRPEFRLSEYRTTLVKS